MREAIYFAHKELAFNILKGLPAFNVLNGFRDRGIAHAISHTRQVDPAFDKVSFPVSLSGYCVCVSVDGGPGADKAALEIAFIGWLACFG